MLGSLILYLKGMLQLSGFYYRNFPWPELDAPSPECEHTSENLNTQTLRLGEGGYDYKLFA